jgi:hypothetical protein
VYATKRAFQGEGRHEKHRDEPLAVLSLLLAAAPAFAQQKAEPDPRIGRGRYVPPGGKVSTPVVVFPAPPGN